MLTNCNKICAVLLGCVAVMTSHEDSSSEDEKTGRTRVEKSELPSSWPEEWNSGIIPFVYDYFCGNPKSFIKIIRRGHDFIRHKACLRFHEQNPIVFAQIANLTYLYYTYSGVLEECCGTYFSKDIGRRLVLITPKCRAPAEVAHATLHALGLVHGKGQGFSQPSVQAVLYPEECMNTEVDHHHENNGILATISTSVEIID
ncbi:uncharacterized protein [Choristoneura fumiferana]|uniref:uncharacterized protein n=1 Tax=Choristoneura fumiferana TaxID=7141 RepID=UPI003D15A500